MKVVLATGIFPPDIGGPATYVESLATELERQGHKVAVLAYSDTRSSKCKMKNVKRQGKMQNYPFPVARVSRRWPKLLRHTIYFCKLLRLARKADVIYAQNPLSAGLPALFVSKILRKRLIVKVVGDSVWESARSKKETQDSLEDFQNKKYGPKIELLRVVQRWVVKSTGRIITPSSYLKNIVEHWGVVSSKIVVVYNGIEQISTPPLAQEQARKQIGLKGDIILSAGRLSPWKGFNALIEIMPELLKENPDFKLIIIGDGPEEKNLKSQIARCSRTANLKIENKVELIGKVSHEEMPLYFKAADLFILNSEYEGLSHVLLEAMQYNLPVIASNRGGNPELIENGRNGFLVEYNNKNEIKKATLEIWRSKELQEKFIQGAKEKLKQFTFEKMIDETLKILTNQN